MTCPIGLGQAQLDPGGKGVLAGSLVGVLLVLQEPSFEDRLRREAFVRLDRGVQTLAVDAAPHRAVHVVSSAKEWNEKITSRVGKPTVTANPSTP